MKEKNESSLDPEKKITVEIVRHKEFVEMLKSPRLTLRVLLAVTLIMVCFFFGLTILVVSIKTFFPYHTITTNPYGATIMEEEDKTVSYWLFNTATLWSSSGIRVKEGDVLTIRASGSMHTAIHHLVDNSRLNTTLIDPWMDTKGGRDYQKDWAPARAKHRIAAAVDENVLLMRVKEEDSRWRFFPDIQDTSAMESKDKIRERMNKEAEEDRENTYVIGRERVDLTIHRDGVLQFAVNDVVLSSDVVIKMYNEECNALIDTLKGAKLIINGEDEKRNKLKVTSQRIVEEWTKFRTQYISEQKPLNYKPNEKEDLLKPQSDYLVDKCPGLYLFTRAVYYASLLNPDGDAEKKKELIDEAKSFFETTQISFDSSDKSTSNNLSRFIKLVEYMENHGLSMGKAHEYEKFYPVLNEYNYYYEYKLEDAWFVDNVGSFLIVVEQRNHR